MDGGGGRSGGWLVVDRMHQLLHVEDNRGGWVVVGGGLGGKTAAADT